MHTLTIARWLAKMAVKEKWKAQGKQVKYIPIKEVTEASNAYLSQHPELLREAWEHPYIKALRLQQRLSLARKAVIAEIRHNGGKVNSIEPDELRRLIEGYLSHHPELREIAD